MAVEHAAAVAMSHSPRWHPVARSEDLRAGENIVAAWALGQELALWRSGSGAAQVWDNRCPHRSVRLTLGHVQGERLVCGYHGWQWCAGSGACGSIPAHPGLRPPDVAVHVHRACEQAGLVWVALGTDAKNDADTDVNVLAGLPDKPPADAVPADARFCRALPLRVAFPSAESGLLALGWARAGGGWPGSFSGVLGGIPAHALLLQAQPQLCVAWLWIAAQASPTELCQALLAARQLRNRLQSP